MSESFDDLLYEETDFSIPVVHVLADHTGNTGTTVVQAASEQFDEGAVRIERYAHMSTRTQIREYFDALDESNLPSAVFHTFVDEDLRLEVRNELNRLGIPSIDILGPAISVLSTLTGLDPKGTPGIKRPSDERYMRRVEAMNFFMGHDEGQNPQDFSAADVVLLGVSRTNKTPISMYLAFLGFKVANVELGVGITAPEELLEVPDSHIFGLVSSPEELAEVRSSRLEDDEDYNLSGTYAQIDSIKAELDAAQSEMKRVGCTIIDVSDRAVEEIASEIAGRVRVTRKAERAGS